VAEQLKLLGLYVLALLFGASALFLLRGLCVKIILGRPSPEAVAMIARLSVTMVFVGLLQALALWSLASRWIKLALLYGGLGLAYWVTLLCLGKSPANLLHVMPTAAGIAFGTMFFIWLITILRHKSIPQS
jgi:hypothetical protein